VRKARSEDAPKLNAYFESLKAEALPWFSTFPESCQGGPRHSFHQPMVRFYGGPGCLVLAPAAG